MTDAALAERAREWLFPLTHENFLADWQKRKVAELAGLLAVCANEALERAEGLAVAAQGVLYKADVVHYTGPTFGGALAKLRVALEEYRALKAEG